MVLLSDDDAFLAQAVLGDIVGNPSEFIELDERELGFAVGVGASPTAGRRLVARDALPDDCAADLVVLPVFADASVPEVTRGVCDRLGVDASSTARRFGLRDPGESCCVALSGAPESPDLLLVSVGPEKDGAVDPEALREAALRTGRQLTRPRVACALGEVVTASEDAAVLVAENLQLGGYNYDRHRTASNSRATGEVVLTGVSEAAVRLGVTLAEAANYARDLVNAPAAEVTPRLLAEICVEEARGYGLASRVLGQTELREGGFGGLLAVGAASVNPPVLATVEIGNGAGPVTALVGKGITFDSGGLQIKGAAGMRTMKCDMAGAASALAAVRALADLGAEVNVRLYLACAENAVGSAALRPGDVVRHRSGRTTEIVSTDGEGRLVLADAVAYAAERNPDQLITVATLTGATGLGGDLWGVLGTNADLLAGLIKAGKESGDHGWELPLWEGYTPMLDSTLADSVNYSFDWNDAAIGPPPGAILGGLFLRPFVGALSWAHIDMAATAWRVHAGPAWAAGATGSPTRALVRYLLTTAS